MPNGFDKNLRRLARACAYYRERYGEWPSQARMHPKLLQSIAGVLTPEDFTTLALHVQLRTRDTMSISVGGARGHLDYGAMDKPLDKPDFDLAWQWLDVHPRRQAS